VSERKRGKGKGFTPVVADCWGFCTKGVLNALKSKGGKKKRIRTPLPKSWGGKRLFIRSICSYVKLSLGSKIGGVAAPKPLGGGRLKNQLRKGEKKPVLSKKGRKG